MVDPVTAIGLVGNILALVDFSFKLFASAKAVYSSSSDASPDNQVLQLITNDIHTRCQAITKDKNASPQLQILATESLEIAQDLLRLIHKVPSASKSKRSRKLNCFLVALYDVAKKGEIDKLFRRLERLNSQIRSHLQDDLLAENGLLKKDITTLTNDLKTAGVEVSSLGASILVDIQNARHATTARDAEINDKLERCLDFLRRLEARQSTWYKFPWNPSLQKPALGFETSETSEILKSGDPQGLVLRSADDDLLVYLESLRAAENRLVRQHRIIKSLSVNFREMSHRELQIHKAHQETFKWVFDKSRTDIGFVEWLRNGNSSFWIRGKAGAGKSTLMKYIIGSPETLQHLEYWASGSPLVTGKFFFWKPGSELQKSHEGLLRGLLVEVTKNNPEIVTQMSSQEEQWCDAAFQSGAWDVEWLSSMLDSLIKKTPTSKYCFFIDGLDEFNGHYTQLLEIFDSLSDNDNLKLCISSRPETEFVNAYGRDTRRTLKVEDLTRDDIKRYTTNRFQRYETFRQLHLNSHEQSELVNEVSRKSSGVFLWVVLMIPSLLEGFHHGDNLTELRRRLNEIPEDLENLFSHILQSIKRPYRSEAAQVFRSVLMHRRYFDDPIPLLVLAAMDEIRKDRTWLLQPTFDRMSTTEIRAKIDKSIRRLGYFKGLLEASESQLRHAVLKPYFQLPFEKYYPVDWLHRSVQDFMLDREKGLEFLASDIEDKSESALVLCGAYFKAVAWAGGDIYYTLKDRPWVADKKFEEVLFPRLVEPFFDATFSKTGRATRARLFPILDALENVSSVFHRKDKPDVTGYRVFLLCCRNAFDSYVAYRLQREPSIIPKFGVVVWYDADRSDDVRKVMFDHGLDLDRKLQYHPDFVLVRVKKYWGRLFPEDAKDHMTENTLPLSITVWEASLNSLQIIDEMSSHHESLSDVARFNIPRHWIDDASNDAIRQIKICIGVGADPSYMCRPPLWKRTWSAREIIQHYGCRFQKS